MFTGVQDISCALCTRCTLSLSFPVPVPTACLSVNLSVPLPLSGVILAIMHKPATEHDKPLLLPLCWFPSFQSVSQLVHINPSLAALPRSSPFLPLLFPFLQRSLTLWASLSRWIPPLVWYSSFNQRLCWNVCKRPTSCTRDPWFWLDYRGHLSNSDPLMV